MYGRVIGVAVVGVRGHPVVVEAHIGRGLPSLTLTGLPGATVQDARDRIRPAVESAGFEWPLRRVVVNLSPGNLRKEGPGLDLPVAMGVLAASAQVPASRLARYAFVGELSLKGSLVSTPGSSRCRWQPSGPDSTVSWSRKPTRRRPRSSKSSRSSARHR